MECFLLLTTTNHNSYTVTQLYTRCFEYGNLYIIWICRDLMSSYDFQFYIKFPFVSVTVFLICPQLLNDPKRKLERFIDSLF